MKIVFFALLSGLLVISQTTITIALDKQTVGWTEIISILPGNMKIKAKLDTGADNSSLNAKNIEYFKRDEEKWVRFQFQNFENRNQIIEAKTIRIANIKRHGQKAVKRPVIRLGICIGNTYKEAEVNLTDRSGFSYQMLIGRSFLAGSFVVDPELRFVSQPDCKASVQTDSVPAFENNYQPSLTAN